MIYRQIPRGFVRLTKNLLCNPVADTQLGAQCRFECGGDPGVQKWIESPNKSPSMGQPVKSAISWFVLPSYLLSPPRDRDATFAENLCFDTENIRHIDFSIRTLFHDGDLSHRL